MRRFHELSPRVSLGVALSSHRYWSLASGSFARRCRSLHTLDWSSSWAKQAGEEMPSTNVNLWYFTTVGVSRLHFNRCCGIKKVFVSDSPHTNYHINFNETWANLNSCTTSSVLLAEFWSNLNPFRWICALLADCLTDVPSQEVCWKQMAAASQPKQFANFPQSHRY